MTDKITLADYNIKGFVFCDICAFSGYPNEKVVFKCIGFRSEDEDGFPYKYTVNEFENPDRIHIHRSLRDLQQNKIPIHPSILVNHLNEQFDKESCVTCGNRIPDHSFRDAITSIDMLPELNPRFFKNSIKKLQELVN